jgi:hypothetical protein
MFEKVSGDELAGLEALALRVRNELAAAGLPVLIPGMAPVLASGAEVEVDAGADAAGGVFVGWAASPRLRECALRALRLRLTDDPVLRHSDQVGSAMMQAMAVVLASAGFTVEDADHEYRPRELRVVSGPARGALPVWSLREDEAELPGWTTPGPGQDAG